MEAGKGSVMMAIILLLTSSETQADTSQIRDHLYGAQRNKLQDFCVPNVLLAFDSNIVDTEDDVLNIRTVVEPFSVLSLATTISPGTLSISMSESQAQAFLLGEQEHGEMLPRLDESDKQCLYQHVNSGGTFLIHADSDNRFSDVLSQVFGTQNANYVDEGREAFRTAAANDSPFQSAATILDRHQAVTAVNASSLPNDAFIFYEGNRNREEGWVVLMPFGRGNVLMVGHSFAATADDQDWNEIERIGIRLSCDYIPQSCLAGVTNAPTDTPSVSPSIGPSTSPTFSPTENPSTAPSNTPSGAPSAFPTKAPSGSPSVSPFASSSPSISPSFSPTKSPSNAPTDVPSTFPSATPSSGPSNSPTTAPSVQPSASPSSIPSLVPSASPTTGQPSPKPSVAPTFTASPTLNPTDVPSCAPTFSPNYGPTIAPTPQTTSPTNTASPTLTPSLSPSTSWPSSSPTVTPTMLGCSIRVTKHSLNSESSRWLARETGESCSEPVDEVLVFSRTPNSDADLSLREVLTLASVCPASFINSSSLAF